MKDRRKEDGRAFSDRLSAIVRDQFPNKANRITSTIGLRPIRGMSGPRLIHDRTPAKEQSPT